MTTMVFFHFSLHWNVSCLNRTEKLVLSFNEHELEIVASELHRSPLSFCAISTLCTMTISVYIVCFRLHLPVRKASGLFVDDAKGII